MYLKVMNQRGPAEVGGLFPETMGMSVAVLLWDNYLQIFDETRVGDLIDQLKRISHVIGYHVNSFDLKILQAYGFGLTKVKTIDLSVELEEKCGRLISFRDVSDLTLGVDDPSDDFDFAEADQVRDVVKLMETCCNRAYSIRQLHRYGQANSLLFCRSSPTDSAPLEVEVEW